MALAPATFADTESIATLPSPWALQVSGTAQHFRQPENARRTWNQRNWGIGLQYEQLERDPSWTRLYSVGSMKDSLGVGGGYAGVTEFKELFVKKSVKVQAGLGLFALWRTFKWSGNHTLVVAPLPVIHVEDLRTGLGLNLLIAPPLSFGSGEGLPGFAFFQLTKRF